MTDPTRPAARVAGLDGLRGLAAVLVVLYHCRVDWLRGAGAGVDVFFPLSGYVITRNLLRERSLTGTVDLRRFWVRRLRRLMPASAVAILLTLAVARFRELPVTPLQALSALFGFKNWSIIAGGPLLDVFVVWWSLSIEEQYYLLYPLLVLVLMRSHGPRVLTIVLAVTTVLSVGASVLHHGLGQHTVAFYGTHTRWWEVLVGCLLAVAGRLPAWLRWPTVIPVAVLLACQTNLLVHPDVWFAEPLRIALVVLSSVMIIDAVVAGHAGVAGRGLATTTMRRLGTVSYEIYLLHTAVLILDPAISDVRLVQVAGIVVLTVAAAAALHLVVAPLRERPTTI